MEATKEVEEQFKEEDAYQDRERERRGRERKRQEEETQKLREESRTATLDDPPPANLFPTLVRQRSSNSSNEGIPDVKKVKIKTDMKENENT